ncbi:MAG TPA: methyltransferase domain-containing protein [Bdellovibrionota bacterium]
MIPFELDILENAHRYQKWIVDAVKPHLGKRVLELGSGIGNMSRYLPVCDRLVLSEADAGLARILEARVPAQQGLSVAHVDPSRSMASTFAHENLDTVVSFNVLEHVLDDGAMIRDLLAMLTASKAPGPKRLVSFVPAHQWAFGEVDKAFGHYRRYSEASYRALLQQAGITDFGSDRYDYTFMNLPGLLGWCLNGRILKRTSIGRGTVQNFETLCPLIRPIDDFLHKTLRLPLGNSLLTVYRV